MKVIKRDGRTAPFDRDKIKDAIEGANSDVAEDGAQASADEIAEVVEEVTRALLREGDTKPASVEDIQDLVEQTLMETGHTDVARAYVRYRYDREKARLAKTELIQNFKRKLDGTNIENQNANLDERSFSGRMNEAARILLKDDALSRMSKEMREDHLNNLIYIHDLDSYSSGQHNCADGKTWVQIRKNREISIMMLNEFAQSIGLGEEQLADLSLAGYSILSRDGWTKIHNIVKRNPRKGEKMYTFKCRSGLPLSVTGDHRVPVIRDGEELLLHAEEIKIGDSLLMNADSFGSEGYDDYYLDMREFIDDDEMDLRIINHRPLNAYLKYKYGKSLVECCESLASKDYPLAAKLTLREFVELSERYPLPYELVMRTLVKDSGSKHAYPMLIPVSTSLAKLFAYIYCDGGVYKRAGKSMYQLTFTNTNYDIMVDFCNAYEEVFGYRPNICQPSGASPCYRLTDGSKIAVKIFKAFADNRKTNSGDIRLPSYIVNGSDEVKYAFLSAFIDTDGCLSHEVTFHTCSKAFAEQTALILTSLGYHPHVTIGQKAGTKYHFGKSNRTGVRQFDNYIVMLTRREEYHRFCDNIETQKNKDETVPFSVAKAYDEAEVKDITVTDATEPVYDLETGSHWFSANNFVIHNCLSIPIDDLLRRGFSTRQADVRSPRSVNTALQLIAVIMQLQSLQQFGGVAATHLDWSMVPYVRFTLLKHLVSITAYEKDAEESDVKADLYADILKAQGASEEELANADESITELVYDNSFDCIGCLTSIYTNMGLEKCLRQATNETKKDIFQGAEALYHNLNTLQSRSGQQLPFSSINYGTCTLPEGRWVIDSLLDASIDGVGPLHKTPIFPCGIFQYMRGVNDKPGTPNYDMFRKALKSTSLRLYPNYCLVDWDTDIAGRRQDRAAKQATIDALSAEQKEKILEFADTYPKKFRELGLTIVDGADRGRIIHVSDEPNPIEIFSTMGCRTTNGIDINYTQFDEDINRILDGDWEGEFHFSAACQKDGRGNVAPTTLIMPEIAMMADRDVEKFMVLLDQKIHDAKDHLLERLEHVCEQPASSAAFMYGNRTMTGFKPEEGVRSAIQHGTIVIGQLGLAETLQLLIGADQTTPEGMALAKRIEELFKTRCAEFKQKYHQNFGVYYTPAENLCYTAMLKFREKHGIIENVSDHDFFTNSMHVPVWHDMTPFEKIDIESELTGYSNAGCITYVELDSETHHNIDALEELVTYAMDRNIPYFACNCKRDQCLDCGYTGAIPDDCPVCGSSNIQRLRRITGYLSTSVELWNLGKQDEEAHRAQHNGRIDACDIME